ncbi:hypothetical protein [Dyella acidiphila]|uniref:HAMP domain-containing protein n=1 Tax=Dyella acidiphila TaxID=2775866 RepID=A0ABR9GEA4_9GAMM|nr:hypothetical protein [Dyella acidiphila]MBE1162371.1 hypothetical protein [Dyella acidiphila]
MKHSTNFLLRGLAIVTLLTVAAALGASALLKDQALYLQTQKMQQAGLVEQQLQKSALDQLALRAQMLAADRDFVEYVVQSLAPDPARGGTIDKLSITDLLSERRQGYDVAMVLDAQGHLVSQSGVLARGSDSIAHDPLVAAAVHDGAPARGAWLQDGVLYWVVVSPLLQNHALKGLLVTASQVESAFFQPATAMSDSDVVLMTPASIVAASARDVDVSVQNVLTARDAEVMALARNGGGPLPLHGEQRDLRSWVTPARVPGLELAVVAIYKGGDTAGSPAPLLIGGFVLFGAVIALLLLLQWWFTWRPLDDVLEVLDRAASGDRTLVLRTRGSAIVMRIGESFNHILKLNRS